MQPDKRLVNSRYKTVKVIDLIPDAIDSGYKAMPTSEAATNTNNTRALILKIGERSFAESGFDSVSLKDMAAEVGIAKSTFFHHFASKQELYAAVVARIFADLTQMLRDEAAFKANSRQDRFCNFFRVFLRWLNDNPNRARIMVRLQLDDPAQARKFSKRFWVPTLRYIESTVLELGKKRSQDSRLFILHILNSMIHFVFSLDSHLVLFSDRSRADLIQAYEKQILLSVERVLLK